MIRPPSTQALIQAMSSLTVDAVHTQRDKDYSTKRLGAMSTINPSSPTKFIYDTANIPKAHGLFSCWYRFPCDPFDGSLRTTP